MTRADEVRRLAEALVQSSAFNRKYAESIAGDLYDAGARMPEPPAPRNPVSRETALASLNCRCSGSVVWTVHDIDRERDRLNRIAPSIVRDLAEAAKGEDGFIVVYQRRERIRLEPAALVAALTRADA